MFVRCVCCIVQGAYKLSEDFAKPYFHKYWTETHDVTTIWKRNVRSFIVTLNAFDVRPTCDTADVQTILPFPLKPSQTCLVWRSRLRCRCALAILAVFLDVVGCKHCPWWNARGRNHTVRSGDRDGQVQKVLSVAAARPTHRPGTCSFRYSWTSLCHFKC